MAHLSSGDGTPLYLHEFAAPNDPRAWLLILHGYGEHGGRYDHVAEALSSKGIATIAPDLRGHGRSAGVRGHVGRFDEYHYDAGAGLEELRKRAGDKPMLLFGHSMGALLATHWLQKGGGKDLRALVLSSPFLGLALEVPRIKLVLGRGMSRYWPTFTQPAGLKGKDVAKDPTFAAAYDTDPLNNKGATARWFTETMAAIDRVMSDAHRLTLPTLLMYGGSDKVASAAATDRFAASLRMTDKTVERVPNAYHELVHEPLVEREKIFEKISTWILAHA
ncbi:MAG: lysophospholipase [Deltaproteobacteria bacterium]|nr:lysophospholipase [Deltaproteobacteria bacterium]